MPKRDFVQVAFDVVQRATGAVPPPPEPKASAVKGGVTRAANLRQWVKALHDIDSRFPSQQDPYSQGELPL